MRWRYCGNGGGSSGMLLKHAVLDGRFRLHEDFIHASMILARRYHQLPIDDTEIHGRLLLKSVSAENRRKCGWWRRLKRSETAGRSADNSPRRL